MSFYAMGFTLIFSLASKLVKCIVQPLLGFGKLFPVQNNFIDAGVEYTGGNGPLL